MIVFHPAIRYNVTQAGTESFLLQTQSLSLEHEPIIKAFADLHLRGHPVRMGLIRLMLDCYALMNFIPTELRYKIVVKFWKDKYDFWYVRFDYRPTLEKGDPIWTKEKRLILQS